MAQPRITKLSYQESDIILAISPIDQKQIKSNNLAASTYRVPLTTLRDRRAGRRA